MKQMSKAQRSLVHPGYYLPEMIHRSRTVTLFFYDLRHTELLHADSTEEILISQPYLKRSCKLIALQNKVKWNSNCMLCYNWFLLLYIITSFEYLLNLYGQPKMCPWLSVQKSEFLFQTHAKLLGFIWICFCVNYITRASVIHEYWINIKWLMN